MELSALSLRLRALSVLRGLLSPPRVRAYGDTLTALDGTAADFADRYGALCATRFSCGDIAQAVLDAVHFDTNTLTDTINAPEAAVLNAATHDLDVLNALLALDGEAFKSAAADKFYEPALEDLPDFEAADSLPFSTGAALADYYREEGYGFFAQSSAFAMQDDGSATPIVHPDAIRLHDLPGYEMQKQKILKNTLAFLDGRDANNILLYGDKGTGKSATVKALLSSFWLEGLRIVEVPLAQLTNLPTIFSILREQPGKFIVFVDDLAFNDSCPEYTALKTVLEGGLEARPSNVVVYATSNRRNIVRQRFSERQDDVNERDTLEEKFSLADRFDLRLTFSAPTQEEYFTICRALLDARGAEYDWDELMPRARAWTVSHNGCSPRIARQFVDYIAGEGKA